MRQSSWSDPTAGLAEGEVDAALVRLPFPGQEALRVVVLFSEPRWAALPSTHPLAAEEEIPFSALWDEPFVAAPLETGAWRDYWLAAGERGGRPPRVGAVTDHPDEWLQAIANGYGVALAPASAARYYARPGVTFRPLTGVSPSRCGVAWPPSADANPVLQDFVRCCVEHSC
ncbi:LysR family substrate-binding domain-containing protein [Nonomuraea typhae]|uniref:LysR family substrate-binding domain-containing protein n=1 Tax=Nonomuraea typhae TaxID=2603600 RepID=UPI001FECD867|nr:LysR family substrate-binding domain-containing protein [Nonomuraea typhae]